MTEQLILEQQQFLFCCYSKIYLILVLPVLFTEQYSCRLKSLETELRPVEEFASNNTVFFEATDISVKDDERYHLCWVRFTTNIEELL